MQETTKKHPLKSKLKLKLKEKATALRMKMLKASDIAAELHRHNEEAEAARSAATDTADKLRLHLLEVTAHAKEVEELTAVHEQEAVDVQDDAYSGDGIGYAGGGNYNIMHNPTLLPASDGMALQKTFWQKLKGWF